MALKLGDQVSLVKSHTHDETSSCTAPQRAEVRLQEVQHMDQGCLQAGDAHHPILKPPDRL
eukprot:2362029-Alexandrium_andersonii.AAC.1